MMRSPGRPGTRAVAALRIAAAVAALAALPACSNSAGPQVQPNVLLIQRFDSLRKDALARFDFREFGYANIEQFLAEGAPIQTVPIVIDGHLTHDSAVASLQLAPPSGQTPDSTLFIELWDSHGPDSVITIAVDPASPNANTFLDFSLGQTFLGATSASPNDTLALTISAPRFNCTSLLKDAPPDLGLGTPVLCQNQTVTISYNVFPQIGTTDTVVVPRQSIRDVRVVF